MDLVILLLLNITRLLFFRAMSTSAATTTSSSKAALLAKSGCQSNCGKVTIPYPFGIGEGCNYNSSYFKITCDDSNATSHPKPFLNITNVKVEVLKISIDEGTLRIPYPITFSNCSHKPRRLVQTPDLNPSPFWFSEKNNKFTSRSCGAIAMMMGFNASNICGCLSICDFSSSGMAALQNNSCGGINCCQTTIPSYLDEFNISFGKGISSTGDDGDNSRKKDSSNCKYAFLVDQDWFASNSTNIVDIREMDEVPVVLQWTLYSNSELYPSENRTSNKGTLYDNRTTNCSNGSMKCFCLKGFQGNPYFLQGCKDINECEDHPGICGYGSCTNSNGSYTCQLPHLTPTRAVSLAIIVPITVLGVLFLLIGAWWLYKVIKKRKTIKCKEKFFKKNGGLLLQQQLSSGEVSVEKIKLFNSKELEKATDRFNVDRILGQGGYGTVYKGMLTDGKIVAVKKSKIADGGEVRQFINEIVILSQIIHRNVVKLLGCCLETEVPLLVYEFVPNGTLSHYIHNHNEEFPLTWEMCLRVSKEVAGALSYLHSSATFPIYHRDVKSANILLDDKYRAKVADFGTSRSIAIDQTHLTTQVHGTFGYLDPEYFQSSQLTDKSDVYSFGVVLVELLTGKRPVSKSQAGGSLATLFLLSMEENQLFEILDARVMEDGVKEEIMVVANLAKRCLNLNGKKRPSMKEVAMELEGIRLAVKSSDAQKSAEVECAQTEISEAWDVVSTSTGSRLDTCASSSSDVQPLTSFKTQ